MDQIPRTPISRISAKVILIGRPLGPVGVMRLGRGIPPRMPGLVASQIVDCQWVGTTPRYCRSWVWIMKKATKFRRPLDSSILRL
jgi:hypothetical protein